jgi:hypothetical protein
VRATSTYTPAAGAQDGPPRLPAHRRRHFDAARQGRERAVGRGRALQPRAQALRAAGLLVEDDALASAEQQCLADEDARTRRRTRDAQRRSVDDADLQQRFAAEIARLFPGCPPAPAEAIARHASLRGRGRVGRSAAGRAADAGAVEPAVIASVRHQDTRYDHLLMAGVDRADARDRVRDDVDRVLESWRRG